jgi:WD40 repeat protein
LYHTYTLDEILFIATDSPVTAITFSPDGTTIASAAKDHILRLWWVEDGKPLGQLEGHKNAIETAVFAPHGNLLASGDSHGELILWRTDRDRRREGEAVAQVLRLAVRAVAIGVHEDDLAGQTAVDEGKGERGPHHSRADDSDLPGRDAHVAG